MRRIGVVTSGRSDVGFYLPLMAAIRAHPDLELEIIGTGMHLSPEFGLTVREVEDAGFPVRHRVESALSSDTPEGVGKSIGVGTMGFAQLFAQWRPDLLIVHGDRFDALPAVLAALPYRIPVAHIAGGDITEGAIDDAIRHAMTKLSHLHFVERDAAALRVQQMGEEPWRVTTCGCLSLDAIRQTTLMGWEELERSFGVRSTAPFLLVTFHPVTLEAERTATATDELLEALRQTDLPCLFTFPNADVGYRQIIAAIQHFCAQDFRSRVVVSAGQRGYWSLMSAAAAMVGNSSSGIVESPSFRLPTVNVGSRQQGRLHPANVIDVEPDRQAIVGAIRHALSTEFRAGLLEMANPYGDGHAAERIVQRLAEVELGERLVRKRFYKAERVVADAGVTP